MTTPASSLAYEAAARDWERMARYWDAHPYEPGADACAASCRRAAAEASGRARSDGAARRPRSALLHRARHQENPFGLLGRAVP